MNKDLIKYIEDFDNGNEIESVEMGGISDGYEIAIQLLAIETARNLQYIKLPESDEDFSSVVSIANDAAIDLLNDGYSGAQVGASKNMAAIFYRQTPAVAIQKMKDRDPSRIIKIRKHNESLIITK